MTPVEQGDFVERGVGVSDELGELSFYSKTYQAVLKLDLHNEADTAQVAPQVEVNVVLERDARIAHVVVFDKAGTWAPMYFEAEVPNASAETTITATEIAERGDVEFDQTDPDDPFAGATQIALVLVVVGVGLALVVGSLVQDFIGAFAKELCFQVGGSSRFCGIFASVVKELLPGGLLIKGFKLVFRGLLRDMVTAGVKEVFSQLLGAACSEGSALVVRWAKLDDDAASNLEWYRRLLTKINYMIWRLDHEPPRDPADVAKLEQALADATRIAIIVGRGVKPGTAEVYSTQSQWDNHAIKGMFAAAGKAIDKWGVGSDDLSTVVAGSSINLRNAFKDASEFSIKFGTPDVESEFMKIRANAAIVQAFNCGLAVAEDVVIRLADGKDLPAVDPLVLFEKAGLTAEKVLDMAYTDIFGGGGVPTHSCRADIYEPNHTWQLAANQADTFNTTSYIKDLSLCGPMGKDDEEDWYAFAHGYFAITVSAEIINVDPVVADTEVCMERYWRDQTTALDPFDDSPVLIDSVCGKIGDRPQLPPKSIGQTTGQIPGAPPNMVFLRVFPKNPGQAKWGPDYELRYTP